MAKELFDIYGVLGTVMLRLSLAALILSAIWRPWRDRYSKAQCLVIFKYGAALGLMNLSFYLSLCHIPLGVAVALEFIGPLSIALFLSRRNLDILWALLAALGIFMSMPTHINYLNITGILFALLAGVFWAIYIIYSKTLTSFSSSPRVVCWGMIIASLVVAPLLLASSAWDSSHNFDLNYLPQALTVAILSSALPYSLEMLGLRRMSAKTFSIFMSLEPVVAALSGLILLNEQLSSTQIMAISCIIIALMGSVIFDKKLVHN